MFEERTPVPSENNGNTAQCRLATGEILLGCATSLGSAPYPSAAPGSDGENAVVHANNVWPIDANQQFCFAADGRERRKPAAKRRMRFR